MEFRIDYDPEAFGGSDGVDAAVHQGMVNIAQRLQSALDEVYETHAGRPPAEVEDRLRVAASDRGFDLDEDDLRSCVWAISEGRRVDVSVEYG